MASINLRVKLHNYEAHMIEMHTLDNGNIHLQSGGDFELLAKGGSGGWIVCSFDTSDGPIKLGIELLNGNPKEGTIRIVAHSSDAL